jgi:hypothetical protein
VFRRSSAVEQLTVNQLVVGSIPTAGAKKSYKISMLRKARFGGLADFLSGVTFGVTGGAYSDLAVSHQNGCIFNFTRTHLRRTSSYGRKSARRHHLP